MKLLRHRKPAPSCPVFSFCEPVTATSMSRWHIRLVGPEGLKKGGGVPTPALCGRDLQQGWDLFAVTADWLGVRDSESLAKTVCGSCLDAYTRETSNP